MKGDKKAFKILGIVFVISILINTAIIMYKCSAQYNAGQNKPGEKETLTSTLTSTDPDKPMPAPLKKAGIPALSITILPLILTPYPLPLLPFFYSLKISFDGPTETSMLPQEL